MKKRVLKKWFLYGLVGINIMALLVMTSECEDIKLFITTHLLSAIILITNSAIILKYAPKEVRI